MGPFVSSQHQLIASGDVDMTPEQYFTTFISSKLAQYERQYPKEMRILLVPSLQDIIHEIAVLPQPAFFPFPTKTNPRPDFAVSLGLPPVSRQSFVLVAPRVWVVPMESNFCHS